MEDEVHLFLDTNVLLHYDALDGIKWRTLIKAKCVVLHVAQPVMDEISLKKDMGETKKLRKRADSVARRLLICLEKENPFRLREGEILLLEPDSPRVGDFPDLNSASRDDQLIASALTFQKKHSEKCYVVTGDSSLTLRVKLRRSKLEHICAPDSSRLSEEPDADERQRNTLQKELLELKRAQPDLKLTFNGWGNSVASATGQFGRESFDSGQDEKRTFKNTPLAKACTSAFWECPFKR